MAGLNGAAENGSIKKDGESEADVLMAEVTVAVEEVAVTAIVVFNEEVGLVCPLVVSVGLKRTNSPELGSECT